MAHILITDKNILEEIGKRIANAGFDVYINQFGDYAILKEAVSAKIGVRVVYPSKWAPGISYKVYDDFRITDSRGIEKSILVSHKSPFLDILNKLDIIEGPECQIMAALQRKHLFEDKDLIFIRRNLCNQYLISTEPLEESMRRGCIRFHKGGTLNELKALLGEELYNKLDELGFNEQLPEPRDLSKDYEYNKYRLRECFKVVSLYYDE